MSTDQAVADVLPQPVFDHLARLSDSHGIFEHALFDQPRPEHGYCVDDVARGLVVTVREPSPDRRLRGLTRVYLAFVLQALDATGRCRNRCTVEGVWTDEASLGDWWGRALWGLGATARSAPSADERAQALAGFLLAAQQRSPHLRAMVFAALGAAEVLAIDPDCVPARQLLLAAAEHIMALGTPHTPARPDWIWPEPRLTYANASLAEVLIRAGRHSAEPAVLQQGLALLRFLIRPEHGHLSVSPAAGRGPGETGPAFDQQPIEVAALADAAAAAYCVTGDSQWLDTVEQAWRWFCGANDSATVMYDARTGAGYDGLEADGRNANRGAESTLAMLATAQLARRFGRQS